MCLDEHVLHDVIDIARAADQLENDGSHVRCITAKDVFEAKRQRLGLFHSRRRSLLSARRSSRVQEIPKGPDGLLLAFLDPPKPAQSLVQHGPVCHGTRSTRHPERSLARGALMLDFQAGNRIR
jgi:hypothetical protein